MTSTRFMIHAWLVAGSAVALAPASSSAAAPEPEPAGYAQTLAEVEALNQAINAGEQVRDALAAAGTGTIEVDCGVPCEVYVNERRGGQHNPDLYLGVYRVWVEAADERLAATLAPQIGWVRLAEAGERARIAWHPKVVSGAGVSEVEDAGAEPDRRAMSRAAEVSLLVLGGGMAIAGGAMFGLAASPRACDTAGAGVVLSGLGGVALLVGGITLTVDEVQVGGRRGRQALLGWRARF